MIDHKQLTEMELIVKLREGDESNFSEIYERNWQKMLDYAMRLTKFEDEA